MKKIFLTIAITLFIASVTFSQRITWISVEDTTENFSSPVVANKTFVFVESTITSYALTKSFSTANSMGEVIADGGYEIISPNAVSAAIISDNTDSINQNLSEINSLQDLNLGVIAPTNSTQSTITIDMTAVDADLTYTAVGYGASGNDITVEHEAANPGGSLSVGVEGTDILITLAVDDSTASLDTLGGVIWTAVFDGTLGDDISIEMLDPSGNNQDLVITVTDSLISVSLATDGAGALTSTEVAVADSIANDVSASALVTAAAETGGATVATDTVETNLSDGYDGGVITSTAADVKTAINGDGATSALVVCEDENAGAGLTNVKAKESLETGADATPSAEIGAYGFKSDFTLYYIKVDLHNWAKATLTTL